MASSYAKRLSMRPCSPRKMPWSLAKTTTGRVALGSTASRSRPTARSSPRTVREYTVAMAW